MAKYTPYICTFNNVVQYFLGSLYIARPGRIVSALYNQDGRFSDGPARGYITRTGSSPFLTNLI